MKNKIHLKTIKEKGLPVDDITIKYYDLLVYKLQNGEEINQELYAFLCSANGACVPDVFRMLETRKYIKLNSFYEPSTYDEVQNFINWESGYNRKYYLKVKKEYETKQLTLEKYEEKIYRTNYLPLTKLNDYKNKEVQLVVYLQNKFSSYINLIKYGVIILEFTEDYLMYKISETNETVILSKENYGKIHSINYNGYNIFKRVFHKDNEQLNDTLKSMKQKLEDIKSTNLFTEYKKTFNTVKGLGYLVKSTETFINVFKDKKIKPDNLLTYCFETMYTLSVPIQYIEEFTLLAYNTIINSDPALLLDDNYNSNPKDVMHKNICQMASALCKNIVSYYAVEEKENSVKRK